MPMKRLDIVTARPEQPRGQVVARVNTFRMIDDQSGKLGLGLVQPHRIAQGAHQIVPCLEEHRLQSQGLLKGEGRARGRRAVPGRHPGCRVPPDWWAPAAAARADGQHRVKRAGAATPGDGAFPPLPRSARHPPVRSEIPHRRPWQPIVWLGSLVPRSCCARCSCSSRRCPMVRVDPSGRHKAPHSRTAR